ncbi:tRNA (adenosine(37)-N6)-dimethylallyltransferase MiaA [Pseudanabaena sp. PCC 6802]|uniref:tRNA (adenosine(37)-N6)-dimethylallyltransferase MiaA n=1 Tax=Pseudanabaena sp. PCC 6802 TaxID=118173 RepID=UPI00034DAB88|nr:tRNA (adenosine(37)-N6)-dimethylallyltransferase MiaA [Pseudanabaena sp. PCC 6802]
MLIVICGATATGKSGLAMALAERLGTEIISADSRQVYREFDVGTAKPSERDRQKIKHHLIDICAPTETLTVADYQMQAQAAIANLHSQNRIPLLVGGTGLYVRSVVKGMKIPHVAPQMELRSQLATWGQNSCYQMLQQVDPISATLIHANDAVRTLRALEVFYVTGIPISAQQGEAPPDYPILQIGLDCQSNLLLQRISQRTEQMLADGWLEEVRYLNQKYGEGLPLLHTLGYKEMQQHLAGKISLSEATAQTILHTRQFAKRQRTWFRGDRQVEWFELDDGDRLDRHHLLERIWERIAQFVQANQRSSCVN